MHGLIHVLGYRNTAVNLADGPNAMLPHVPTAQLTPGSSSPPGAPATCCAAWWTLSSPSQRELTASRG